MAAAIYWVFPRIGGIDFRGGFLHAIGVSVLFTFMAWLVEVAAMTLSAIFAIGTLGLGLLIIVPAWILGQWLLPVLALRLVANVLPEYLQVAGWWPALWGGLALMIVSMMTSGDPRRYRRGVRISD